VLIQIILEYLSDYLEYITMKELRLLTSLQPSHGQSK